MPGHLQKILYTAEAVVEGGREGHARSMDGRLVVDLAVPEAMGGSGLACLPGTHSKWATVEDGRIVGFTTHMTGETFGALRACSIEA